jgi:hypothetical protein
LSFAFAFLLLLLIVVTALIAITRTPTRARLSIVVIGVRVLALLLVLLSGMVSVLATLLAVLLELWCLGDTQDLHSIGHTPRLFFDDSETDVARLELCQVHMSREDRTCDLLVGLGEAIYQEQRN